MRPATALLLACAAAILAVPGCGGETQAKSELTITVGSKSSAEEEIVGEIYAQALEAAGFEVKRVPPIPAGYPPFERKGLHISGYPEHLNIAMKDILRSKADVPGDAAKTYAIVKRGLAEKGLTAFPPTSFSRYKTVGMLRSEADDRKLRTLSDLKSQAGGMNVMANYFCRFLNDCLTGLERFYGIAFGTYSAIEPTQRYEVLEYGEADASILLSTEGRLAGKKSRFVILEDDKHRMPAGNISWVTKTDVAEEAGPEYEKAIVEAQRGLTLKVMQRLDAEVNLEKKAPREVAAKYLKSIGYEAERDGGHGSAS